MIKSIYDETKATISELCVEAKLKVAARTRPKFIGGVRATYDEAFL